MAWVLLCALVTAQRKMSLLFLWMVERGRKPGTLDEWYSAVMEYLQGAGGWRESPSYRR